MTARLAEDVPRRGTMREARNDGGPACYASKMHSASPRLAVSSRPPHQESPVCARFARLDWGYEKFSLRGCLHRCTPLCALPSEAASTDARLSALSPPRLSPPMHDSLRSPLGLPPPTYDSLLSPHKAEGLSAVSASHTYHLCGLISSAALREKSDNQGQHLVSI